MKTTALKWKIALCLIALSLLFFAAVKLNAPHVSHTDKTNRLLESGSKEDVFVSGCSYFCVLQNDEERLVRAGRLILLPHGQLGLRTDDGEFSFYPTVHIPSDTESFFVDNLGVVKVKSRDVDFLTTVGELVCGHFPASRMPDSPMGSVVVPEEAFEKLEFGVEQEAFVVSGWKVEK